MRWAAGGPRFSRENDSTKPDVHFPLRSELEIGMFDSNSDQLWRQRGFRLVMWPDGPARCLRSELGIMWKPLLLT